MAAEAHTVGNNFVAWAAYVSYLAEVSQVLFRLSRWENLRTCPKKFDQDAKDRVVRLVEDRILAENMSMQAACQAVAPKLGVSWHTARQWTQQARRAGSIPEPVPEDLAAKKREATP